MAHKNRPVPIACCRRSYLGFLYIWKNFLLWYKELGYTCKGWYTKSVVKIETNKQRRRRHVWGRNGCKAPETTLVPFFPWVHPSLYRYIRQHFQPHPRHSLPSHLRNDISYCKSGLGRWSLLIPTHVGCFPPYINVWVCSTKTRVGADRDRTLR